MTEIEQFFNMGGYAVFVWSAYFIALAMMLTVFFYACTQLKRKQAELDALKESIMKPIGNIDRSDEKISNLKQKK